MANETRTKEAKAIKKHLDSNPEATVQQIAAATEVPEADVVEILDSHLVGDDGKIRHNGVGGGGGWVPQPEADDTEG